MDIFQFASYVENILLYYDMDTNRRFFISLLAGALCFLIVYIFQGFGLYAIAKREGYGHRWMAWVPGLQIYYIGVCSQKNKVLGSIDSRKFAIAVAVFDILLFAGYVLYYVSYFLVDGWYTLEKVDYGYYYKYKIVYASDLPSNLYWAAWFYQYGSDYILQILQLLFIVGKLFLYTAFYRTYSSRRYVLFSVVGALLPVNGVIVYVVRNNKGLNYNDYLRRVREENYRRYQQQQQQQNMYNQNPYSRGYTPPPQDDVYNNRQQSGYAGPDPFDEYGDSSNANSSNGSGGGSASGGASDDSPFDEFN
ncbi:MAG: hypothetical protein LUD27_06775 [Clostridia bacterium]|nr:hypothetical protein [Clostridia bacterium]